MQIISLDRSLIDEAAELLAAIQREAAVEVTFGDPEVARRLIGDRIGRGPGVAAVIDGRLAGFLIASLPAAPGSPTGRIRLEQHAARPGKRREIYRSLYAALAAQLTALGCFEHSVLVHAGDTETAQTWFELGFGIDQIKGIRSLDPIDSTGGVRHADLADLPGLLDLTVELIRFHAGAPILRPALVDLAELQANFRSGIERDDSAVVVADDRSGMMQVNPDRIYSATATIGIAAVGSTHRRQGIGTALLAEAVDWARERGFEACAAEWASANPVSDRFWRGRGFVPARLTLTRLVDPRVAWAGPDLSYDYFAAP